jgi:hypothetical protein
MAFWPHLVILVGITAFVGCGNPMPDHPASGPATESAQAVVSPPTGNTTRLGQADQSPPPTLPLEPTSPHARQPGSFLTDDPQAAGSSHDSRAQTAFPADAPPPDEQTKAEQAQQQARQGWYAEVRDHPDATVRLQGLEVWAQQPGDGLDSLTYALVDGDEQVRARAQELYKQQLQREAAAVPR